MLALCRMACERFACQHLKHGVVALALLFVGAGFSATAAESDGAEAGNELRIGNGGEPLTLDPHRYNLNLEEKILADLFEGLTTHDADGRVVGGVAHRWQTSADGLTWTFELREDARWSDGAPLTAEDFVFAFQRLLNPNTAASLAFFLYAIDGAKEVNTGEKPPASLGVEALGDHVLRIRLAEPFPFLAERLTYPTGFPVPKHVVGRLGDDWVKPGNMVSNGAFVLEAWQPHGFVRTRKNPHFHGAESVRLAKVTYFPTADRSAAYNRYRNDELHIIGDFPPGEIGWLRQRMPNHLHLSPLLSMMYLVFNVTETPFDDPRVRRALALAIDRQVLVGKVLQSGEVHSASFVPPMVANYQSAVESEPTDPATAIVLLAEAGYNESRPLRITLRYIAGADNKKVQVAIAAMWKVIGVETTLHHAELNAHFAALRQGDFQVAQAGWFGENNPEHYLDLLMSSTGDVNYGRFADAETDALMAQAKATAQVEERLTLLRWAEAAALQHHPVVPLYAVSVRSLVNPRVVGWRANARNVHPARYLSLRPAATAPETP